MSFKLPALPYAYDALEPYIDTLTMEIHHDKHHRAYVDNLNKALDAYPALQKEPIEKLLTQIESLPEAIRTAVRNNGGGHYNHSMFWTLMRRGAMEKPRGSLADAIEKRFGHFDAFKEQFNQAAKTVFGSGWAWLVVEYNGNLTIKTTPNQDNPIFQGLKPVLGLDVWEHAYYLKYQNRRPDYISAWWYVVNWDTAEQLYRNILSI